MKKGLITLAIAMLAVATNAQSVIDADDGRNYNDFYQKGIVVGKKAMPYPALRESDVVWEKTIWRTIDMNEKFNQFFYFPTDPESNTQGRINLVNLIVAAAQEGTIEVFSDDDLEMPLDWSKALKQISGRDRPVETEARDEYGEVIYDEEGEPVMTNDTIRGTFDPAGVERIMLRETWYIDKADTRQKVRITGLAFKVKTTSVSPEGEEITMEGDSFWVPMDDMRVRDVLVNANAFDENNIVRERSYDDIFIQRYFNSYVTRVSNTYNRTIASYLTGEDAILESQQIEEEIFNLESDMWEY